MSKHFAVIVVGFAVAGAACGGVTAGQKADETYNSAKATSTKAWNRVSEQACTKTKVECEAEEAANRGHESSLDAANKAKEAADRVP